LPSTQKNSKYPPQKISGYALAAYAYPANLVKIYLFQILQFKNASKKFFLNFLHQKNVKRKTFLFCDFIEGNLISIMLQS